MLTSSVKSEVQRDTEDRKGRLQGRSELLTNFADKLGVFSSNACQHLKVLVELSLSPGTCRQPQALILNAEQFRGKC